jgi:hypothetical protein
MAFKANPKSLLLSDGTVLRIDADFIRILQKTEEVGLPIGEKI